MKQRTIVREVSVKGKGLHSGQEATLTLKPADSGSGFRFRRVDLYGKPEVRPVANGTTQDLIRQTSLRNGNAAVHTPEHVLSALVGCGIDNCLLDLDGPEVPILDGSAKHYANLVQEAEAIEQDADREVFALPSPVSVSHANSSLIALPYDGLKITCTSADDRGFHTQHLSVEIEPEIYLAQLAPARTFTVWEDIEPLLKLGKIQGGSLDCAIVIKGDKILSKEPLRFKDEFVRHKIVDILGDLALVGRPLKAHIIAVRPGHALNNQLARRIADLIEDTKPSPKGKAPAPRPSERAQPQPLTTDRAFDIRQILDVLPHRYPFVLVDRVISFDGDDALTAVKNVTFNEPFFMGHFPGYPVMPGVLQIEAMAQAAGILMFRHVSEKGKLAFFMSCDKVKFRQAVTPGDQLEIRVKLTNVRGNKLASAEGKCLVGGKVVSQAELMFTLVNADVEA